MSQSTSHLQNDPLLDELAQFTGTTQYHRWSPLTRLVATDGALYLAKNASCFWLLDAIASHRIAEPFQVWDLKLTPNTTKATLTCTDGNNNILARQRITYTDFPLPSIRLYVQEGVIMLPSEY